MAIFCWDIPLHRPYIHRPYIMGLVPPINRILSHGHQGHPRSLSPGLNRPKGRGPGLHPQRKCRELDHVQVDRQDVGGISGKDELEISDMFM